MRYQHTGNNKDVTNPKNTLVANNTVINSRWAGITSSYEDYEDATNDWGTVNYTWAVSGTGDHYVRPGGNNVIKDNTVINPAQSGILLIGNRNQAKPYGDTVTGNTVVNAGFGGSLEYGTGAGTFDTSGVGTKVGYGRQDLGNTIEDNQQKPTTLYGVHIGARGSRTTRRTSSSTGPNGEVNSSAAASAP